MKTCRVAGCHGGDPLSAGLRLDENVLLYDARRVLLDQPNHGSGDPSGCPQGSFLYIDSARPVDSLLWLKPKATGDMSTPPCGGKMPVIGNFTPADKQCIQNWILTVIGPP
jgi:hypothetical protein